MSKQLSVVNIVRYKYDATSAIPKHKHQDIFQIFYVLEGTASLHRICALSRKWRT